MNDINGPRASRRVTRPDVDDDFVYEPGYGRIKRMNVREEAIVRALALEQDDSGVALSACGIVAHASVIDDGPTHENVQYCFGKLRTLEETGHIDFAGPTCEADIDTRVFLTEDGREFAREVLEGETA